MVENLLLSGIILDIKDFSSGSHLPHEKFIPGVHLSFKSYTLMTPGMISVEEEISYEMHLLIKGHPGTERETINRSPF